MWKIMQFVLMTMVSAPMAATAAVNTPQEIVDRHVVEIKKANLEGLMADYADDAVVVTPPGLMEASGPVAPGVFVGKDNVRKVFAVLIDKDHIGPVRSMVSRVETQPDVDDDYEDQNAANEGSTKLCPRDSGIDCQGN